MGAERDDNEMWGGVNFADERSLASAWRGSSRQTIISVPHTARQGVMGKSAGAAELKSLIALG